jgi:hypothetical protein
MASTLESIIVNINLTSNSDTHLIAFNFSSQLHMKPTPSNFPSWYAQLMSLLVSYDIRGYLDGTIVCLSETFPNPTTGSSSISASNLAFWHWFW